MWEIQLEMISIVNIIKECKVLHIAEWIYNRRRQWNNHITDIDKDTIVKIIRDRNYKDEEVLKENKLLNLLDKEEAVEEIMNLKLFKIH